MLARLPFVTWQWFACKPREGAITIAEELDAGAVHEQVEGSIRTAVRDLDGERLLPPAQRRVIQHGPVQTRHLHQAGHHPGGLPERQLEQDLNRQAEPDRRITEHRRSTGLAVRRRKPGHPLVQPDQQRSALAQRRCVVGPVRRAVTGG
jgi:hypothetical protein